MYTPLNKPKYYEKMRKYTHRLPPHRPENYSELMDEIKRKKQNKRKKRNKQSKKQNIY